MKSLVSISKSGFDNTFKSANQTQFETIESESVGDTICQHSWSNIEWEGERKQDNFKQAFFIALDFDGGKTIKEILSWCEELALEFVLGTTKSHQKEKPNAKKFSEPCDRFRLILPTESVCSNLMDYRYTLSYFIDELGADRSCRDGARFFFPCQNVLYERKEARKTGWIKAPATILHEPKRKKLNILKGREQNGAMPVWISYLLMNGAQVGSRHSKCYAVANALFEYDICQTTDDAHRLLSSSPFREIDDGGTYLWRTCEQARQRNQ